MSRDRSRVDGRTKNWLLFLLMSLPIFTLSCVSKEVQVTDTYYETEYKTEYKMEPYTETEDVVVRTSEGKTYLTPISKWQTGMYFEAEGSGTGMTYYYGYEISTVEHPKSRVKVTISPNAQGYIGIYDLTGVGQIPAKPDVASGVGGPELFPEEQAWFDSLNTILTNSELVLNSQPMGTGLGDEISFDTKGIKEFAIFANTWNIHAISSVKLVWSDDTIEKRTVTKERQVPYEVPVQVEKQRTLDATKKVPIWEAIFAK